MRRLGIGLLGVALAAAAAAGPAVLADPGADGRSGAATGGAAASRFHLSDLRSRENAADYLIVAPAALRAAIEPLAEHRAAGGLRVAVATLEQVEAAFPGPEPLPERLRAFLRRAATEWRAPRLRYLLLCGDGAARAGSGGPVLPPWTVDGVATDNPYGCVDDDSVPDLAVGRLPADGPEELAAMVARILAYERAAPSGEWRRQFAFACGEGGFGPLVDGMIEGFFTRIVGERIPPEYDVDVTYLNPSSPYCYPPGRFPVRVVERLNQGALVFTYVGHGSPRSFSGAGAYTRVLDVSHVGDIDIPVGPPVVIVLACSTGRFADPAEDCIGETLLKRPRGPVAFIGSSAPSSSYGNALLGSQFVRELFREGEEGRTLGETLVAAKRGLVKPGPDPDPIRAQIDGLAVTLLGPGEAAADAEQHLALYNLLGDPALRLARPAAGLDLAVPEEAKPGRSIKVRGTLEGATTGRALVTFECERTMILGPLERLDGASGRDAVMLRNYRRANDKVAAAVEVPVRRGKFEATLKVPRSLEPGRYLVKAFVHGDEAGGAAIGAAAVTAR